MWTVNIGKMRQGECFYLADSTQRIMISDAAGQGKLTFRADARCKM